MTRTYDRETILWEQADLDALEVAGRAIRFPGLPGWVVDKKFAVRDHQIIVLEPVISDEKHQANLDFLYGKIVDHDTDVDYRQALQAEAEAKDVSVEELTDGEYILEDGIPVPAYESPEDTRAAIIREENALLARFGV